MTRHLIGGVSLAALAAALPAAAQDGGGRTRYVQPYIEVAQAVTAAGFTFTRAASFLSVYEYAPQSFSPILLNMTVHSDSPDRKSTRLNSSHRT